MSELRWILAGVGILVILILFLWGKINSMRRRNRLSISKTTRIYTEPFFEDDVIVRKVQQPTDIAAEADIGDDVQLGRSEPILGEQELDAELIEPVLHDISEPEFADTEKAAQTPEIVVIHVAAREGNLITGKEVVAASRQIGLLYGKMKIFHKVVESAGKKESLFGIANMLEPGIFEPSQFDKMRTPGLTLFLQIPAVIPAVDAFDSMLETADQLAKRLNAVLLDENREVMEQAWIDDVRYRLVGK